MMIKPGKIERMHPSLQCALNDWIENALPVLASQLIERVPLRNGQFMTLDSVTLRMADAAIAALQMAAEAAGLDA